MTSLSSFIKTLQNGVDLNDHQMIEAMSAIMNGACKDEDLKAFLLALSEKGESTAEITGAAHVMRSKAAGIQAPDGAVDCCGTGGDASGTYNISTAVALVAASCGAPIAKHGNRASSSKSGAADVLEALGVNLDAPPEILENALFNLNFAFLMAPNHHQSMKHVAAARKSLAQRTIFNLLGPLANPAGTKTQLIGVFDPRWCKPLAETLRNLGSENAMIVHGAFNEDGGLDEISTCGETHYAQLTENGEISEGTLTPEDFGLPYGTPADLVGGDAKDNAAALRSLLDGENSAYRDIVLANTAAVLMLHGTADNLKDGIKIASEHIDNHKALQTLENYITMTNSTSESQIKAS